MLMMTRFPRNLLMMAAVLWTVAMGCKRAPSATGEGTDPASATATQDSADEVIPMPVPSTPYEEEVLGALQKVQAEPGYRSLRTVPAIKLFSYLSGHYPSGHPFPILFLDPVEGTLTVTHKKVQTTYPYNRLQAALDAYKAELVAHGYKVDGKVKDNARYVDVNGAQMVYMELDELLPDETEAKLQFTAEQYDFIYHSMSATAGFAYLSGVGNTGRDYPMMAGTGYQESARLHVLGKGLALAFKFEELDAAFQAYRNYVVQRMGGKAG